MKNKIIEIIILAIFIITSTVSIYKVQAYTGEIDPKNYITLPQTIWIKNKVGTGTITLSSSATGYTISYEKVDITKETLNTIDTKYKAANDYVASANVEIKKKEENVKKLQEEYQNLQKETEPDEDAIQEAQEKYTAAYQEYNQYYEEVKTEYERLLKVYLEAIPTYTGAWKETTNSTDNVQLDFKDYTGTAYFILWVKISNGTDTYYDFMEYSSEIKEESGGSGQASSGDWTDFSKAQFSLKKDGISKAIIEISGVTPKKDSSYYLFITSNSNKPNVTSDVSDERITLSYDETSKTLKTTNLDKVAEYVEKNQDLYVSIVEHSNLNDNVVIYGKKLNRYEESKYSDAFHATFMTYSANQIVTNFTHAKKNNRKIQIKVGKITDNAILQKIKNQDSSGFANLLSYAKSNSGIYNQTLGADVDDSYAIEYNAGTGETTGNKVIDLKGLENEAYYYLYVKTDDENGKYITNEAVTLARANVYDNNHWYMFFYGSSDFKWADFGDISEDKTVAPSILPRTGIYSYVICGIVVLAVVGVISYKIYKKYNF